MKEPARLARNTQRLTEMDPPMAGAVRKVLKRMEDQGFRPRIQAAWRSPADQLLAFHKGTSHLKFGFHNVTGPHGEKQSLAADVLDDNHPLSPPTKYLLALAIAARAEHLHTGILWDLPAAVAAGTAAAIAAGDINRHVKIGFDPTHVEPVTITVAQAKAGKRPTFGPSGQKTSTGGSPKFHVVVAGETLGGIAKKFSLTLERILELNPDKRANPNLIVIGEKVRVA